MDEPSVVARLGALRSPDPRGARARAELAVAARVGAGEAKGLHRPLRLSPRPAAALGAAVLAVAAFSLATSPGQAFTSWVGQRLGFGHPGEHPTLRQLRHWVVDGRAGGDAPLSVGAGQAAYVLARGPAPHDDHWEYITFRSNRTGAHCFEVELPRMRQILGAACEEDGYYGLAREGGFSLDGSGGNAAAGMEFQILIGRISDDVDSVRVSFDGRRQPVQIVEPPRRLFEQLGFNRTFRVFASFPSGTHGGRLTVEALKDGRRVGRRETLDLPDLRALTRLGRRAG
jgi:hypothetical protein